MANRTGGAIVAVMNDAAAPPSTASVEERLARLEAAAAPRRSALDRLLRFLPVIALGNLFLAVPAMLVSAAVAYFTFVQAAATEKMQVASVWPRVTANNFNSADDGDGRITLSLSNKGVGPAVIEELEVRYRGQAFADARALLAACCGAANQSLSLGAADVGSDVLRPGEEAMITQLTERGTPPDVYARFNSERRSLDVRVCYCSVFGDCWIDSASATRPRAVRQCPADWVQYTAFPQATPLRR